jgi:hypothetical protein
MDMINPLKIIVTGYIAQYPLGGVCWDYLQYATGLARMGHDVYYIEDTGQWPFNPSEAGVSPGCEFNVEYLKGLMGRFGLGDRWAYCFSHGRVWYGMPESKRREVMKSADVLLNVSGALSSLDEFAGVRRLVYIDSDPVFTQIKLAIGNDWFRRLVDSHDVHFSFGEGLPGCAPETGHTWHPTRQPIVLTDWSSSTPRGEVFSTVMNWTSYEPVVFSGKTYGQKNIEFQRFIDLPSLVAPASLELAVNAGKTEKTPRELLLHKGWQVVDPDRVCPDYLSYRDYIESSYGEWSIAKNGYVAGRSGWFSCRSACYLAAGKPVVVQDTGFSSVLPVGKGLLAFTDMEEAVAAIADVRAHYREHCIAAREIAVEYFDSTKVLGRLIDEAMRKVPVIRDENTASRDGIHAA